MNNIKIIRSAINCIGSLGLLKFFKENSIDVIGTDISENIVLKDFLISFYKVSRASEEKKVINEYFEIIKKEKPDFIISGPEEEIFLLQSFKEDFLKKNVNIFHPDINSLMKFIDKRTLYKICIQNNIKTPDIVNIEELKKAKDNELLLLKPFKGRGSNGVIKSKVKDFKYYKNIIDLDKYIIQEYISGSEFTVDCLFNEEGIPVNIIPRKRINIESGITTIGKTLRVEEIENIIKKISKIIKFYGVVCVQFIENNGQYFLIDINPRFGGGAILSLKSSISFRKNLIKILNRKEGFLENDFEEMTMHRYYDEFYT